MTDDPTGWRSALNDDERAQLAAIEAQIAQGKRDLLEPQRNKERIRNRAVQRMKAQRAH